MHDVCGGGLSLSSQSDQLWKNNSLRWDPLGMFCSSVHDLMIKCNTWCMFVNFRHVRFPCRCV